MPIREMTPEEKAEFDKKHPLGTMLIFRARQTPSSKKQSSTESSANKTMDPPPSQEEIDANNRICEAAYRYVMEHYQTKA